MDTDKLISDGDRARFADQFSDSFNPLYAQELISVDRASHAATIWSNYTRIQLRDQNGDFLLASRIRA